MEVPVLNTRSYSERSKQTSTKPDYFPQFQTAKKIPLFFPSFGCYCQHYNLWVKQVLRCWNRRKVSSPLLDFTWPASCCSEMCSYPWQGVGSSWSLRTLPTQSVLWLWDEPEQEWCHDLCNPATAQICSLWNILQCVLSHTHLFDSFCPGLPKHSPFS